MLNISNITIVFLLVATLVFSCRCNKDEDSTAPLVTMLSPFENQTFLVGETIPVKFTVSDESRINFVQITLLDENGIQVLSSITLHDLENEQLIEQLLPISNTGLLSGAYTLSILVSDGNNEKGYFTKIYLQELPLEKRAVFFIGYNQTNYSVYKLDSTNTSSLAFILSGDYIGSAMDSKYNHLITCGGLSGKFQSISVNDYSTYWSQLPVGSAYPSFRSISSSGTIVYVSYNNGFIKGFDYTGAIVYNESTAAGIYYPQKMGISSTYLLSEQVAFVGGAQKLVLYTLPAGSAVQEVNFSGEVVEMFAKSASDFFIFYNQGNNGKISLYEKAGNGLSYTYPFSLGGKILSVVQISGTEYIVSASNGIYKFSYSPQNYSLFIPGKFATKMRLDEAGNQLILLENKTMQFYNLSSGSLLNTINSSDSLVDFQVHYNR
ncbi:MAG TPA: hypothetical protein PLN13_05360 [Bacteroidia bacterium]|nr:hypothetical protein [Bacteroidia bacterium]HRH07991.1 hypothetical protein [Bacteroidia bacterium]